MTMSYCTHCRRDVPGKVKARGKFHLTRHECDHGRLCIGASAHRKGPTIEERRSYCVACADTHAEAK